MRKSLLKAQAEHVKFLAKHGITTKRPKLKGIDIEPLMQNGHMDKSSKIPEHGAKGRSHTPAGDRVIGQAYNKGPLMVLSSKDELKNSSRRDRG